MCRKIDNANRYATITSAALDPSLTDELPVLVQLLSFQIAGRVRRSVRKLAEDVGKSTSWVQRRLEALRDKEVLRISTVLADGSYVCEIAERFLPRRRTAAITRRDASGTRKKLSSGVLFKTPSESATEAPTPASLSESEIPEGWIEAAENERRLAGLPVAGNLQLEWRKLVNRSEGQRITRWRWIDWALKARPAPTQPQAEKLLDPEIVRWTARLRGYAPGRYWSEHWGPRPGEPGCEVPRSLLNERGGGGGGECSTCATS